MVTALACRITKRNLPPAVVLAVLVAIVGVPTIAAVVIASKFYVGTGTDSLFYIGISGVGSSLKEIGMMIGYAGHVSGVLTLAIVRLVIAATIAVGVFIIWMRAGPVGGIISAFIGIIAFVFVDSILATM